MPLVKDQAICIRHWDWSETSQTVSLFARETGIVRCIAKGAKREKSNFSGGIELLTRGEMNASIKSTEGLALLTSWDLLETFSAARRSLSAFHAGMAILDIVQQAVQDADPHPGFFDAVLASLRNLGSPQSDRGAVLAALWAALSETGHAPELMRDVRGGSGGESVLPVAAVYPFFPALGGFSLVNGQNPPVEPTQPPPPPQEMWKVRGETVHFLRELADEATGHKSSEPNPRGMTEEPTTRRALQLLFAYFRTVFNVDPVGLRQFVELSCT